MRVELNGHWAEIDETPLMWGARNKLRAAANKDFWLDFAPALVTTVVKSWSFSSNPNEAKSWEPIDPEFGDEVFAKALGVWKAREVEDDANPTVEPSES